MKKLLLLACMVFNASLAAASQEQTMPFYIYRDKGSPENHFIPSGWMGDWSEVKYNDGQTDGPYAGDTCIEIVYLAKGFSGSGWAGLYWQDPANNWGKIPGGFNLGRATKCVFQARGGQGTEVVAEFKVGGIQGAYPDSGSAKIGPVILTSEWQEYSIYLSGVDLSSISGGFCWSISKKDNNGQTVVFYLDEIRFE